MKPNYLIPVIPFEENIMVNGRGSFLYDANGKRYLDLNSGQFCAVLGHSNREIIKEIENSAGHLCHTASNIISDSVVSCAENLHRISGAMKAYSITLSTGSEAVEFALRFAKHIKGRESVICFDKGYHGLTLGSQSVTFSGRYSRPLVKGVASIGIPNVGQWEKSVRELRELLETRMYACVLLEPIVSVGGMIFPEAEFFKEVRLLCNEYDTLLIFDESQTGFGRTGNWFAYQTLDVVPDMAVLAKGIGLGFPVSAVLFHEKLIPQDAGYGMTHYSSHQNDPFSANVVNVGIRYMEKMGLLERIQKTGRYFLTRLNELEKKNEHIVHTRGCGLMMGGELDYDVSDYRPVYHRLYRRMMDKGVIIQGTDGGHTLRFLPDYMITETEIDFAVEKLDEALNEMGLDDE